MPTFCSIASFVAGAARHRNNQFRLLLGHIHALWGRTTFHAGKEQSHTHKVFVVYSQDLGESTWAFLVLEVLYQVHLDLLVLYSVGV